MVIPIHDSFLYVEPLYLKAEQSQLPELKRVIVSNGERIAMEETLEGALATVFGEVARAETPEAAPQPPSPGPGRAGETSVSVLASEALDRFRKAQERLKTGDFAGYGQGLKDVEQALERLRERSGK